jgi:hypothetical protein
MSGNPDIESYESWKAGMRKLERPPLTRWRLQEIFEATCRYGSGNCWTGATGKLAAMIRELLLDRERLLWRDVEVRSDNEKGDK